MPNIIKTTTSNSDNMEIDTKGINDSKTNGNRNQKYHNTVPQKIIQNYCKEIQNHRTLLRK